MNKKAKKIIIWISIIFIFIFLLFIFGNEYVIVKHYEIQSNEINGDLEGFKIVLLSDFHNKRFIDNQNRLLSLIRKEKPDIIVMAGDMIYTQASKQNNLERLIFNLIDIAPIYYALGNSETELRDSDPSKYNDLIEMLNKNSVIVLDNNEAVINHNGQNIILFGTTEAYKLDTITNSENKEGFTICINHYPYSIWTMEREGIYVDLLLSGHNHGGEIRVPFLGGLYSPDQGFFAHKNGGLEYGHYQRSSIQAIVTGGLSSNGFPKRINNLPEIVSITLNQQK